MWENVRYSRGLFGEIGCIVAEKDGVKFCIPMSEGLPEYREIMALVAAGELTIAPAE
jgi:hypothetical protein